MSAMRQPDYVELQATSNFSFLRGASHPQELALAAAELGHKAIAVTDRNSLAGLVRAHQGAKEAGIRLIVGARLDLQDGFSLLAYPTDRAAYGRLCRLLTLGKRRAPKGECHLALDDVVAWGEGLIAIALPPEEFSSAGIAAASLPTLTLPRRGGGERRAAFPGDIPTPVRGPGGYGERRVSRGLPGGDL